MNNDNKIKRMFLPSFKITEEENNERLELAAFFKSEADIALAVISFPMKWERLQELGRKHLEAIRYVTQYN